MKINLTANNKQEELILHYLENNASETLTNKINNGTLFEKDGKPLINKKTLSGFMKYACDEARKHAEKGATSACIDDATVYGWAIHFFEEESIEGTLYTIDGAEYKPVVKAATKQMVKPTKIETKSEQVQWSLFDMVKKTTQENEVKDNINDTLTAETDANDDEEFTEEEKLDALRQVAEEEQSQTIEEHKGNKMYQDYMLYQNDRPTAVVTVRLGDFYEVLGDNAVMLGNELDLTITSRDVGLKKRIPMIGFPYHAAENYFAKIVKKHDLYIVENELDTQFIQSLLHIDNRLIAADTGEILSEEEMREFDGDIEEPDGIFAEEKDVSTCIEPDALNKLKQILGDDFIVR